MLRKLLFVTILGLSTLSATEQNFTTYNGEQDKAIGVSKLQSENQILKLKLQVFKLKKEISELQETIKELNLNKKGSKELQRIKAIKRLKIQLRESREASNIYLKRNR